MRRVFKIKRLKDGLYSGGGSSPSFRKLGKTWNTRAHLDSHLRSFQRHAFNKAVYDGCVIEELEIVETVINANPVFPPTTVTLEVTESRLCEIQ